MHYLSKCPHQLECDKVLASPYGLVTDEPELNGKRVLIVGLNANDSQNYLPKTREEYSKSLRESMQNEIRNENIKCLSKLIPPIALFLAGIDSTETRLLALKHLNWCNIISCCPEPTSVKGKSEASKPTKAMRKNCLRRIIDGDGHELLHRISSLRPTHILVVGGDARDLWERAEKKGAGASLFDVLNHIQPRPIIRFAYHPSQRTISHEKYKEQVLSRLSG